MYTQGSVEFNQIIETPNNKAIKSRLVLLDDNTIIDKIKSLILYSASCSQELQIGTTNMAYIDAEVESNLILTNREVRLECGVELSDGTVEYIPMGVFTIQKPQGDIDFVKFTANDRMQKFDYPYSSILTYPTTDKAMLEELATMCGVTLATNIDNPITIDKALDGYTRREVLGYIAGLHGKFACFNRNGELELKWYNADNLITKNIGLIWGFEKSDEDFTVGKIEVAVNSETTLTSGNGYGVVQHSNPLATQEIVNDLFTSLNGFTYNASVVDILDDIRLDLGDVIKVTYLDGKDYLVPCMSIKQDFTQGSTNIESFAKSDTENTYRFTGPTVQYLNRMAMELLVANRVIATKVDAEYVNSHAITTENFEAKIAEITELVVDEIDGKYANIDLANIDIANINVGKIGELFAKVGLIDRATIVEGHITGFLDAVEVNANKITAGTLIADRILLSGGEKGVLYALNNLGELTSTNVDTLDGYVLTDRTITADKIIANSITANELDVNQIFGNEAVLNKLVSQEIFSDAVATNTVVVGIGKDAKEALDLANSTNTASGNYILVTDSAEGILSEFKGYGRSTQKQGNFYDGELLQGYYAANGSVTSYAGRVSAKNLIPCSEGNEISFKYSETTSQLLIAFFKAGAWTSQVTAQNTSIVNATAPSGVDAFGITISQDGITPSNAKTISVTVNGNVGYPNPDYPQVIKSVGDSGYFDGDLVQGYLNTNGDTIATASYITSKNTIPCNEGDVVNLKYQEDVKTICFAFYDKDMVLLSRPYTGNVSSEYEFTAPANTKYMKFHIQQDGIAPANAKHICVTINGKYAYIVKSKGKNLEPFNYRTSAYEHNGITFTPHYDDNGGLLRIHAKGTSTAQAYTIVNGSFTLPAGTYIMSGCPSGGSNTTWRLYTNAPSYVDFGSGNSFVLTEETTFANIVAWIAQGKTVDLDFYPMIRLAEVTDDSYEPYKETVTYIPLTEPLRSSLDGSVRDVVSLSEINRKFAEAVFNGTENWVQGGGKCYYVNVPNIKDALGKQSVANIISSHFKTDSYHNAYYGVNDDIIAVDSAGHLVGIYSSKFISVAEFKAWLQANPITVQYELAEPIIEPIEPMGVTTYAPATYITNADNADMWVKYYRNVPTGIQLAKLATLETDNDILLANWASKNDITLIDGAKIYTGSITADKINVNDLFAQDITATGTITGAHLISNGTTTTTIFGSGHNYTLSPINWGWSDSATLVTGIEKTEFGAGYFTLNERIKFSGKGFNYQDTNVLAFNTDGIYSPKINAENLAVKERISSTELITTDITVGSGGVLSNGDVTVLGNIKTVSVLGSSADLTVDGKTTLNGNTTVKGQLVAEQGTYVSDIGAVGWGSEGYIVLARMEITDAWITGADIEFDIQCTNGSGKVLLRFNKPSVVTDTRLNAFTAEYSLPNMYYVLTVGTNSVTIDLIAKKTVYQIFRILNIRTTHLVQERLIITYPNAFESTLRAGAVQATMETDYFGNVYANGDVIAGHGSDKQASLSTLWDMVALFPPYELTDIDNPQNGIGLAILKPTGGGSTLYLSFTFFWITIQFAADTDHIWTRKCYGNNGWTAWTAIQ